MSIRSNHVPSYQPLSIPSYQTLSTPATSQTATAASTTPNPGGWVDLGGTITDTNKSGLPVDLSGILGAGSINIDWSSDKIGEIAIPGIPEIDMSAGTPNNPLGINSSFLGTGPALGDPTNTPLDTGLDLWNLDLAGVNNSPTTTTPTTATGSGSATDKQVADQVRTTQPYGPIPADITPKAAPTYTGLLSYTAPTLNQTQAQASTYQASQVDPNNTGYNASHMTGQGYTGQGYSANNANASSYNGQGYNADNAEAATYTGQGYSANNANAASYEADKLGNNSGALVENRLNGILSQDSDYIKRAETEAAQYANSRGLLNTTMAAAAGRGAAIDRALPIAQQDAATINQRDHTNMAAENAARQYNASNQQAVEFANQEAANRASEFGANANNTANQFNAANQQNVNLSNQAAQNRASEFSANANNTANQYNASNQQAVNLSNQAAQNRASEFNSNATNAANQFNAANQQQAAMANQNADNAASQFNATQRARADEFNATSQNAANQYNASNAQQNSQFNAQQANQMDQINAEIKARAEEFGITNSLNQWGKLQDEAQQSYMAVLNSQLQMSVIDAEVAANLRGSYLEAMDRTVNNYSININEIMKAENITADDKRDMIAQLVGGTLTDGTEIAEADSKRGIDVAYLQGLYESMPQWGMGWSSDAFAARV